MVPAVETECSKGPEDVGKDVQGVEGAGGID